MGKILAVVGNLGAGKTTLTNLICDKASFTPYWEKPEERPFTSVFAEDKSRWALANQMDFFLFRCEQEHLARQKDEIAVFDAGFDQDFHVFTRHIHRKGYLNQAEYHVCQRFYHFARDFLPPPDILIRIVLDIPTLLQRRAARGRKTIDLSFHTQELTDLEMFIDDWLNREFSSPVLRFPFEQDFQDTMNELDELIIQIKNLLKFP